MKLYKLGFTVSVTVAIFCVGFTVSSATAKPGSGGPNMEQLKAAFKEQGAAEDTAVCAAHAVVAARGHGAYKSYTFEAQQLKDAKVEDWNAPLEPGMAKPMATRVSVYASGVSKAGVDKKLHLRCGVNSGKVEAFVTRDTSIKIKIKS